MIKTPYVLSVDRADYTKGIINRLRSIDTFFDNKPELKRHLTFAQICTRTRSGLEAYDQYWLDCQRQIDFINKKHGSEGWEPILNVENPMNSPQLALLYRNASVMLVNPLKDGLNLTAKEFVACQTGPPGVLALSPAAGVWSELGRHSVAVDPTNPDQIADAVHAALTMSRSDKSQRIHQMLKQLRRNTLSDWCNQFVARLQAKVGQPLHSHRAIS
jgi:trehalose 6-phosphate synthase